MKTIYMIYKRFKGYMDDFEEFFGYAMHKELIPHIMDFHDQYDIRVAVTKIDSEYDIRSLLDDIGSYDIYRDKFTMFPSEVSNRFIVTTPRYISSQMTEFDLIFNIIEELCPAYMTMVKMIPYMRDYRVFKGYIEFLKIWVSRCARWYSNGQIINYQTKTSIIDIPELLLKCKEDDRLVV